VIVLYTSLHTQQSTQPCVCCWEIADSATARAEYCLAECNLVLFDAGGGVSQNFSEAPHCHAFGVVGADRLLCRCVCLVMLFLFMEGGD